MDVDVYVPSLVERAFGSRLFAASTSGRVGGGIRSAVLGVGHDPPALYARRGGHRV